MRKLFEINPAADLDGPARRFATSGRAQVADFLTIETAREIRTLLAQATPWGLAVQAGNAVGPQQYRAEDLVDPTTLALAQIQAQAANEAASRGDFAFVHGRYSLVEAYLGKWAESGPHDLLVEYLNTPEFLQPLRHVSGIAGLIKADAHASLFAPTHYLNAHSDEHVEQGWQVAYVLNFAIDDWHSDWGGQLVFYDSQGSIIESFNSRFNTLNLFRVPQLHAVTYVPPFAPIGRYAISGWARDR